MEIEWSEMVHDTEQSAFKALRSVGAEPFERLTLEVDVDGTKVRRVFGILGNLFELAETASDQRIAERLWPMLRDEDNARTLEKLERRKLAYTPVNKRALRKIADDVIPLGIHLPWTFRPMNFDLASRASKVHRQTPLPWIVFYSQQFSLRGGQRGTLGRMFSLPIVGSNQGTWAEPIYDALLDPDVALILEANVRC